MVELSEVKIGNVNEISAGGSQVYQTPLGLVAVFRTRMNQVFATAARCPHMGGLLSHALYDGVANLSCPIHGYTFNITSGACTDETLGRTLEIFQVRQDGETLYIQKKGPVL